MKIGQVAVQLYTVREHLKTPADIAASLKKIKAIGYEAVQLSGLGPIGEDALLQILKGEGLKCCSTHESSQEILDDTEKVIEHLQKLNCKSTAYPFPGGIDFSKPDSAKQLAAQLNVAGEKMRKAGIVLTYHNHHIEFRKVGGRLILDVIYEDTDPRNLQGEIDTYWVQYGGQDPIAWCKKLKGRLPLLHMKDYKINAENKPVFAAVGEGNLDWPAIVKEAEASGCEWFIVEQDTCEGSPFDALKSSFDYIKGKLTCC